MERLVEMEDFEDLKLYSENISGFEFKDCLFKNCSFEECSLKNVYFKDCIFENCTIMNIKSENNTVIQSVDFISCQIIGINWQDFLPSLIFMDPINKIETCCLKYNTFFEMNFKKFKFSGNEVVNSMFSGCDLAEADFFECNLNKTEFFKADLRKANFRESKGYQIDITTCKLKQAKFSMPEVVSLLNILEIDID